jgi:glycosyltransferase involved in cell wall biosynthesis
MAKARIIHLVNQLGFDGTSRVVLELCRMDTERYDIEVVTLTPVNALQQTADWPSQVKVTSFDFKFDPDYSLRQYFLLITFPFKIIKNASDILLYLQSARPEILHCHLQPRESVIAIEAAKRTRCRLVYTDHLLRIDAENANLKMKLLAMIYRKVYSKFFVVAVSRKIFESQEKNRLIDHASGHRLVTNRIDTRAFTPPAKRSCENITVIYVSRMERRKGHETLLRAWATLKTSHNLELCLVGGGALQGEYQKLTTSLHPFHPVTFTGDRPDVAALLQSAHVGVFPSFSEGMPIALLEMMSCGLPVVVSDIPELRELVTDGINCILFRGSKRLG